MTKRSIIFYSVFSIAMVFASFSLMSKVMPELKLDVELSREELLEKAKDFAEDLGFKGYKSSYLMAADNFYIDYCRLKLKGVESLNQNIELHKVYPYRFNFRFFEEGRVEELHLRLDLKGGRLGFDVQLPDKSSSPDLGEVASRAIADQFFKKWCAEQGLNRDEYKEVEHSSNKNLGHHQYNFVYESTFSLGDAKNRHEVGVIGDKVTSISQYVKLPHSFLKEYNDMRSKNMITYFASAFLITAFYLIIIALFFYFLIKKELPVIFSSKITIAMLATYVLSGISNIRSAIFFRYNTFYPMLPFVVDQFVHYLSAMAKNFILFFIAVSVGVVLDERAFPGHISFRSIFNKRFIASREFFDMLLRGYFIGAISLASTAAFYIIANSIGWTTGISSLFMTFNEYFPYFTTFAHSIRAGLFEELLFRVVPIAVAVLLSKRLGKWIVWVTILLQAITFGAAHADYAAEPFYFRVVELIIPSLIFALSYWRFGLFTGVVSHFFYDYILFSYGMFENIKFFGYLPAVVTSLAALAPIVAHFYLKSRLVSFAPLNHQMAPERVVSNIGLPFRELSEVSNLVIVVFCLAAASGIGGPAPKAEMALIKERATSFLENRGFFIGKLSINCINEKNERARDYLIFKGKKSSISFAKALSQGLFGPEVVLSTRDEERRIKHDLYFKPDGELVSFNSFYDEELPFDSLDQKSAVRLAERELVDWGIGKFEGISVKAVTKRNRKDWDLSFKLSENERVNLYIVGDRVVSLKRYFYLPQEAAREEGRIHHYSSSLKNIADLLLFAMIVYFLFLGFPSWSFKRIKGPLLVSCALFVLQFLAATGYFRTYLAELSFYENLATAVAGYFFFNFFSSVKLCISIFIILLTLNSLSIKGDVDMKRKLLPSLLFLLGLRTKVSNVYTHHLGTQRLELFNGISNLTVAADFLSSHIWLAAKIALVVVLANHFKRRWISYLMFTLLSLEVFSTVSGLYIYLIIALGAAILFCICYELGWKYDPSSVFLSVALLASASLVRFLKDVNLAFGAIAVILVMAYIANEFCIKDDRET